MKILKSTLLFLCICLSANAQQTMSLNGTWNFGLQKAGEKASETLSGTIDVPSNWAVKGWEEPHYAKFREPASIGHYSRTFSIPQSFGGKRVLLHFDGVWACAEPVLNGHELGRHDSGFTSFSYDVTEFLNPGENRIDVKVTQDSRYYTYDTNDDWSLGGIYRDVWLETMPADHWLEQPVVITTFDRKYRDAVLTVKTIVTDTNVSKVDGNFPSPSEPFELRYTLTDASGNTVLCESSGTIPGQDATDQEVVREFKISRPHQWNAETPYLYTLDVELLFDGSVKHSRRQKVGFREVRIEDGVFKVNGVAVKLRGVNRHDEHPDVGRATRREHWLQDLEMMKDANVNYVRICHYTPAKGFIDLCDSIGMYVSNEVAMGFGEDHFRDPSYVEGTMLRAYETVSRDINAPSIIFWTIGNEDPFTSLHLTTRRFVKSMDPTRPAAMPWRAEEWLPEDFEILAPHYWQPDEYEKLLKSQKRPVVSTEYTHGYGTYAMGGLDARWKSIAKYPNGTGAAVWMWQDQGVRTPVRQDAQNEFTSDPYLRLDGQGWDGVVDSDRNPTRDLDEVKAVYAQVFPAVDRMKFSRRLRIPIHNDFDFTNLKDVTVRWQQYADGECVEDGYLDMNVKPHRTGKAGIRLADVRGSFANSILFTFLRQDGSLICHRSVELYGVPAPEPAAFGKDVNPTQLIAGLKPVIWHKLDNTEHFIYSAKEKELIDNVDFSVYEAEYLKNDTGRSGADSTYVSSVRCSINPENSFTADLRFRADASRLHVEYSIVPEIQLEWIPVYGMTFDAQGLRSVKWAGPGYEDSYPNKRTAPVYGMWEYDGGLKAFSRIILDVKEHSIVIEGDGYFEVDPDKPTEIRIYGNVVSRPEKARKAIAPFPTLKPADESPFEGKFTITYY